MGVAALKFSYDHDLHIHSTLSICGNDPEETPERILAYAKERGLHTVCLTDHFWDEALPMNSGFYRVQNLAHIQKALPLPTAEGVRFLFGCETELDSRGVIGVAPEHYDLFDFIIVPTTHLHMRNLAARDPEDNTEVRRAEMWVERFQAVLDSGLPLKKVGIPHSFFSYGLNL